MDRRGGVSGVVGVGAEVMAWDVVAYIAVWAAMGVVAGWAGLAAGLLLFTATVVYALATRRAR